MKTVGRIFVALLALASCYAFGFFWRDIQSGQLPLSGSGDLALGVKKVSTKIPTEQAFKQNFDRILSMSTKEVDASDLKFAAMEGLVAGLADPHSNFFVPRIAKAFSEDTQGNFFGVGAKLGMDPLGAKVATVFTDGPAFKAGLKELDVISHVDDVPMAGKAIEFIVSKVKGPEGSVVKLGVLRPGTEKEITLKITRARISTPTVDAKMLAGTKIGYVQVLQFSEVTALQYEKGLTKLEEEGMNGLVIDLRGNPGGLLNIASDMLSRYFDDKIVVKMKFREELLAESLEARSMQEQRTNRGMVRETKYPIMILVNEDSASASEIFAGVMQDYKRATIIGEHSYGKASVQNVYPLKDNSSIKLTVAKYYLPSGRFIGRTVDEEGTYLTGGLKPDIEEKIDESIEVILGDVKTDSQLRRAISEINKKLP